MSLNRRKKKKNILQIRAKNCLFHLKMPSISFICEDLVKIFIKKTVVIPNLSNHIAQIQIIFFFFSVIIISKESIYLSFKYIPFLNYFLFILLNTLSDYYPRTYHEFNLEEKDTLFFSIIF
jgi:hypothetical protein